MPTWTFELLSRFALAALLLLVPTAVVAHPARGIVAAPGGVVYFSDLERIWSVAPDGRLALVREHRGIHTHALALTRGGDLLGEDSEYDPADGRYRESIWRISRDGRFSYVYGPTKSLGRGVGLMRDARGCTYHSDQTGPGGRPLVHRKCPGRAAERLVGRAADDRLFRPALVNDVAGVALAPDGSFYFRQGTMLRKRSPDGRATVLASGLTPENFGIALDPRGNVYVAEFARRRVLRITSAGRRDAVISSAPPWHPTGVAFRDGALFVLEATGPRPAGEAGMRVRKAANGTVQTIATVRIPRPR